MKPSDLSIGYWVRMAGTPDYFQIEEVYTVELVKGKRIMLGGRDHICGYEFYYYSDEIEPIPINGEILKKNGFSISKSKSPLTKLSSQRKPREPIFTHSYGGSKEKPAEEVIEIVHDLTHNEWTGEFFGPEGLAMQVRIRYVHELQRIMRCMGIDHDIVL